MPAEGIADPDRPLPEATAPGHEEIDRHSLVVRITHWINVIVISLLLMSGLQIFNAHPRLYWGKYGGDADHPWLEMTALETSNGGKIGVVRLGDRQVRTTGMLGVSAAADGTPTERGFPRWATLPAIQDLATGRRWHIFLAWLFVANGLAYLILGALNGHFRRDLALSSDDVRPANIGASIVDHIRLKHPVGEAAKRYNVLQKFAYLAVVFVLLPVMVLTGLTMSPGVDAAVPWLLDLFGGRQSARSVHFIAANLIVLFVIVHLVEVVLAGPVNEIRSMITGRYVIRTGKVA
jgi:thiosulfate reductase cytochrome b subunit